MGEETAQHVRLVRLLCARVCVCVHLKVLLQVFFFQLSHEELRCSSWNPFHIERGNSSGVSSIDFFR